MSKLISHGRPYTSVFLHEIFSKLETLKKLPEAEYAEYVYLFLSSLVQDAHARSIYSERVIALLFEDLGYVKSKAVAIALGNRVREKGDKAVANYFLVHINNERLKQAFNEGYTAIRS